MTAQLVAFKLTAFAPLLIIVGFLLSLLRARFAIFGKSICYIGFVFFSLNLISASLQPLQQSPELLEFLQENYSLVSLSIESNYRSFFEASARGIE